MFSSGVSNEILGRETAGDLRRIFLERLIDPITWFTLGLVFVGLAQWRALRRQVEKMTDAARAAKDSVDEMQASTAVARAALDHAKETAAAQLEETRRANALTLRAWLVVESVETDGIRTACSSRGLQR
jgi:hypothetical protein